VLESSLQKIRVNTSILQIEKIKMHFKAQKYIVKMWPVETDAQCTPKSVVDVSATASLAAPKPKRLCPA
jgi:hypothetical protein